MTKLQYVGRNFIFLALIVASVVSSCDEKQEYDVQEGYSREKAFEQAPPSNPKILLEPEVMEAFLPLELTNAEKYPWCGGFSSDNVQTWSTVSTDYVFDNRGFAHAAIFDYGPGGFNDDEQFIHNLPDMPGFIVTRIKNKYGPGYLAWIPDQRKGKIAFLAADRFVIKIDIDKLPDYIKNPEVILGKFNLEGLVSTGEKRVEDSKKK